MLCWLVTEPQEKTHVFYSPFQNSVKLEPITVCFREPGVTPCRSEKSLHYVSMLNVQEVLSVSMWETKSSVCHHTKQRELLAR